METPPTRQDSSESIRITIVDPVVLDERSEPALDIPGVIVDWRSLTYGTESIQSRWDDAFAAPGILDAALRAEESGADAVVVNSMGDPGVAAVRIPVVGPAEASMHLALCLADRFTILTTQAADIPVVRELVERHGLEHRCVSIRAIGLPVLGLRDDDGDTLRRLVAAARLAIDDGAGALIVGCTLLAGVAPRLSDELALAGPVVPVIDPLLAALHHAHTLVRLGVTHSPIGYPRPDAKPIVWPGTDARFGPRPADGRAGCGR